MKTILIVDDHEMIRKMYGLVFSREGYHVLAAKNALEANMIVKNCTVDLMLLDIKMPKVDGKVLYDVTRPFKKDLKVIVSSVYPLDDQKRMIEGATDYFDKSEGIKALKEKVKQVLLKE
jgi:DNA-binding NtrC family response regulator